MMNVDPNQPNENCLPKPWLKEGGWEIRVPALQRSEECIQNLVFLQCQLDILTYFLNESSDPLYPNFSVDETIQLIRTNGK